MTSGVVRRPLKVAKSVLTSIGRFVNQLFKPGPVKVGHSRKSGRQIREILFNCGGGFAGPSHDISRGRATKLMVDVLDQGHQEDRRVTQAPRQKGS